MTSFQKRAMKEEMLTQVSNNSVLKARVGNHYPIPAVQRGEKRKM